MSELYFLKNKYPAFDVNKKKWLVHNMWRKEQEIILF